MEAQKKSLNRRNFLKSSVIGASGLVMGGTALNSSAADSGTGKKESEMICRTLGNTGIRIPVVSMGVMRADNPNLVKAALDQGIKFLDTANGYQHGRNEEMLGKLLKDYPRDAYYLATKIHLEGMDRKTGKYNKRATEKAFLNKFNISMKRLDTGYVDILYHHAVSSREAALHKPVFSAMKKIKDSGQTKFVGISTHQNVPEVIRAAIESNFYEVVLAAYNFKQKNRDEIKQAISEAASAGLGVVVMKTMAGGFLDKARTKPVNTRAALKWALQSPDVHTSIPGFTSFDQLEESLGVGRDLELSDDEQKDILTTRTEQDMFCNGCSVCLPQCKKGLPVPDLMRAYMYTYGYHELQKAQELVVSLNLEEDPCSKCGDCTVHCTNDFNVAEKISDVTRLTDVPADFLT